MSRISTIPISLDPSIHRPHGPPRSTSGFGHHQSRSVTLAPTVYDPAEVSRKRSSTYTSPSSRAKDLPAIPRSPWPLPRPNTASINDGPPPSSNWIVGVTPAVPAVPSVPARSAPPSRNGPRYAEKSSSHRRSQSNPPSRTPTFNMPRHAPPRPSTSQSGAISHKGSLPNMRTGLASSQSSTFHPSPPPSRQGTSRMQTPSPPSRQNTSRAQSPSPPSRQNTSRAPSRQSTIVSIAPLLGPSRGPSFQTRYMNMLLSLDQIPRLHNILASFFGWILLAGFIVFPGTFTSLQKLQNTNLVQQNEEAQAVLKSVANVSLLVVAIIACSIGIAGNLWLAIRWRNNYVWLLNKLYMPGTLNALVGLISTLTNVYAQQKGSWSVTAQVAVAVEGSLLLIFSILFVLYNNWLLQTVKNQHHAEMDIGARNQNTLKGKVEKLTTQPAFAPGSVV